LRALGQVLPVRIAAVGANSLGGAIATGHIEKAGALA
jgi:hypothetical protein